MFLPCRVSSQRRARPNVRGCIARLAALAALSMAVGGWGCAETAGPRGKGAQPVPPSALQSDLETLHEQQEALRGEVERVADSLRSLERSLGTMGERIAANLSSIERLYARVDVLSSELETVQKGGEEPPGGTAEPAEEAASLRQVYAEAYSTLTGGDYLGAIEKFRRFVEQCPQSRLADNAQFWIAESYLALKDYDRALEEYRKVERNYPNGNRVPDALLRSGQTFYALDDVPGYVRELKRVIQLFPQDRAAQIAAESIAKLVTE